MLLDGVDGHDVALTADFAPQVHLALDLVEALARQIAQNNLLERKQFSGVNIAHLINVGKATLTEQLLDVQLPLLEEHVAVPW